MADHHDGSNRLFAAACRVVEHDLDDDAGVELIRAYESLQPFPRSWSDQEILQRIRDAEKRCQRGSARAAPSKLKIILGTDEHRVVDEAIAALQADEQLYQRGGLLVRILRAQWNPDGIGRADGSAMIAAVPVANLRERLTRYAHFTEFKTRKMK